MLPTKSCLSFGTVVERFNEVIKVGGRNREFRKIVFLNFKRVSELTFRTLFFITREALATVNFFCQGQRELFGFVNPMIGGDHD